MTPAGRRVALASCTSIAIPLILLGILIYCCYVFIGLVVKQYLIHNRGQSGAAAVVLIIFFILLILALASYLRILQTRWVDADYTPRGSWKADPQLLESIESNARSGCIPSSSTEKPSEASGGDLRIAFQINPRYIVRGTDLPPPGLDEFYSREAFVCDSWGLPLWCNYCAQYKKDRTHHFSDVDRCARRGDHFCVWVGGIVSESNHKFFVQFCFWSFLLVVHILIATVVLYTQEDNPPSNSQWIVVMGISAWFVLFAGGMTMNNAQFAWMNLTTVENFSRTSRVYFLAVHIRTTTADDPLSNVEDPGRAHTPTADGTPREPPPWPTSAGARPGGTNPNAHFRTITYPLPRRIFPASSTADSPNTKPPPASALVFPPGPKRTFAILRTAPGDNPWDRGPRANLTDLLGPSLADWLLPLRRSPLAAHADPRWEFPFGPALARATAQAGLAGLADADADGARPRCSAWEGQSVHVPAVGGPGTPAAVRPGEDAAVYVEGRPADASQMGFSIETDDAAPAAAPRRKRRHRRRRSAGTEQRP